MKVHRWQPSGKTPCGRNIADVQTNIGYYLSDGVTCESCHKATTFLSIMGDDWNGQSYGYLPGAARDLWEADLDGNCPSKSELGGSTAKRGYMRNYHKFHNCPDRKPGDRFSSPEHETTCPNCFRYLEIVRRLTSVPADSPTSAATSVTAQPASG